MKIDEYNKKQHNEQLPLLKQVFDFVTSGKFWLMSVRIDEEEFGARRIVIFLKPK